jgi:hypothetical protein
MAATRTKVKCLACERKTEDGGGVVSWKRKGTEGRQLVLVHKGSGHPHGYIELGEMSMHMRFCGTGLDCDLARTAYEDVVERIDDEVERCEIVFGVYQDRICVRIQAGTVYVIVNGLAGMPIVFVQMSIRKRWDG